MSKYNKEALIQFAIDNPNLSYEEIAARFGLSKGHTGKLLRAAGVVTEQAARRPADYDKEALIKYALANPGLSYRELGEHFGINGTRVGTLLRDRGIESTRMALRDRDRQRMVDYAASHPREGHKSIAAKFGRTKGSTYNILSSNGVRRAPGFPLRRLDHETISQFTLDHPEMFQREIAAHFGTTQTHISKIMRAGGHVGNQCRAGGLIQRLDRNDEQYKWEKILSDAGLGMARGASINGRALAYGHEYRQTSDERSCTLALPQTLEEALFS